MIAQGWGSTKQEESPLHRASAIIRVRRSTGANSMRGFHLYVGMSARKGEDKKGNLCQRPA